MNDAVIAGDQPPVSARPRRGLPKVLIILAVVAALFISCAGAAAYFFLDAVAEVDDVEAVVEEFLVATSNGNAAGAYSLFSSEVKDSLTLASFGTDVSANRAYHDFAGLKRGGWRKNVASGRPTLFTYDATVNYTSGSQGTLHAELVREDGEWRIRFIQVNSGAGTRQ